MRHFVIPEIFFKSIAEKGKLYSRLWFYWLSEFVDEIFKPEFIEQQIAAFPKVNEIKEVYDFGVQLLQQDFKIIEQANGKKAKTSKTFDKLQIKFAEQVLDYLNQHAGTSFTSKNVANVRLIVQRFSEGYDIEDFKKVIDKKVFGWKGTDRAIYLRPLTLFSKKFENYLNELDAKSNTSFDKFTDNIIKAKQLIDIRKNS